MPERSQVMGGANSVLPPPIGASGYDIYEVEIDEIVCVVAYLVLRYGAGFRLP